MREHRLRAGIGALALLAASAALISTPAEAQGARPTRVQAEAGEPGTFSTGELVDSGHQFFGTVSRSLALTVQEAVRRWGEPNGYVLGEEAAGAFFGGLRYGEGTLYTRGAGRRRVFWQGPSLGFDVGGEGARTMMLVYNMPSKEALFRRFVGVDGSAYLVGGFGMTAAMADEMVVVPIRSGVGARLGVNLGYLKFTSEATWNPF
ncbi:MAG TPA: DUF1134 domain-containing protein [Beijerinckiaceae bacterium]